MPPIIGMAMGGGGMAMGGGGMAMGGGGMLHTCFRIRFTWHTHAAIKSVENLPHGHLARHHGWHGLVHGLYGMLHGLLHRVLDHVESWLAVRSHRHPRSWRCILRRGRH